MPRDKDLGKIVDEGDFIEIDLGLKAGHYQFRFTHKTAKPARNIKVLNDGDVVKIPNYNGKKSLFEGRNFFIIYKHLPDGGKERIDVGGFNRWLLFLKARTITSINLNNGRIFFTKTESIEIIYDVSKKIFYHVFVSQSEIKPSRTYKTENSLVLTFDFPTSGYVDYLIV